MDEHDGIIRKGDMFDYCAYRCDARNFNVGIWYNGRMYGIREKFGDRYIDYENHWDDGPEGHGTCKPLTRLTAPLSARLDGHMFDIGNWRGHIVLQDMLFVLEEVYNHYFKETWDDGKGAEE